MKSTEPASIELKLLKSILWVYIVLCIIIAGLNFGYVSRATPAVAAFITWLWGFYENWVKTLFIVIGSFLTLRIIGSSQRTAMRKRNLIGFMSMALVVHILGPLLLNNKELYFFAMPLPWSTIPLQLLDTGSAFYLKYLPIFGLTGISLALIFYLIITIVVFAGTLLFGRRWQCSTLCLFNGFAAEVFDPVIPLIGKKKKVTAKGLKIFAILRWLFFALALCFTFYWILILLGMPMAYSDAIAKIENYKYLTAELLMAMFFWIAFVGRGYCYYCPLGTVLGLVGKIAGQRINTNLTNCIQCGRCNAACPMSIDIKSSAKKGSDVSELRCVGCGHCVDSCPQKTLAYATHFLEKEKHQP
ncbi:4Fe-4S dicluster domain-containing protein [Acetobacterium paludosum]|uniref:4Fe-4S dicluster domain-containing protein n=1 Tax=Acetobacterium paludosum TaxID=52693 RepID=A0A923I5W0_9FIRM|nr:4Fe-4S dicluster domain-containing protein [Acetobacterium paludosum]MBC3889560.1 4Fe-4S dicluster domain-containing protein [Acetobacterium paludosum]